jgi:hypothetical protein
MPTLADDSTTKSFRISLGMKIKKKARLNAAALRNDECRMNQSFLRVTSSDGVILTVAAFRSNGVIPSVAAFQAERGILRGTAGARPRINPSLCTATNGTKELSRRTIV